MTSVKRQVWDQVSFPVSSQVWAPPYKQVNDQVIFQINNQIWAQIRVRIQ